ncbi:MAG: hypothetical protein ACKOBW_16055, partial [Planctomycetota bacterium]
KPPATAAKPLLRGDWDALEALIHEEGLEDESAFLPTAERESIAVENLSHLEDFQTTCRLWSLIDSGEILDVITSTTGSPKPSWDSDGGAGKIDFLHFGSLAFVRSDLKTHHEIRKLLADLRQKVGRPGPNSLTRIDDNLILFEGRIGIDESEFDWHEFSNVIMDHVSHPTPGWRDNGGTGEAKIMAPRSRLVVRQSAPVHDELQLFLTNARRTLYEQRYQMRPWESLSLHYLQPHVAAPSTDRATDDELQLLTACRDRRLGAWVTQQNRVRPLVLDVQRNGDRVELRTPR